MSKKLYLRKAHWLRMQSDAENRAGEEACGLVAGNDSTSTAVFRMTNELHSPIRYRLDPGEQLEALLEIDEQGWDLLAIYHSHLGGPDRPSATDIAEAMYPGVTHIIWYPTDREWACKGYLIKSGTFEEVEIVLEDKSDTCES